MMTAQIDWKDKFELIPYVGIKSSKGDELKFDMRRKETRSLLGEPDGAFTRDSSLLSPMADNYGHDLDGHFQVHFAEDPDNKYLKKSIPYMQRHSEDDKVVKFEVWKTAKMYFRGIKLHKSSLKDTIRKIIKLGFKQDKSEKSKGDHYFPSLGLNLYTTGKLIHTVEVCKKGWWEENRKREQKYYNQFG